MLRTPKENPTNVTLSVYMKDGREFLNMDTVDKNGDNFVRFWEDENTLTMYPTMDIDHLSLNFEYDSEIITE